MSIYWNSFPVKCPFQSRKRLMFVDQILHFHHVFCHSPRFIHFSMVVMVKSQLLLRGDPLSKLLRGNGRRDWSCAFGCWGRRVGAKIMSSGLGHSWGYHGYICNYIYIYYILIIQIWVCFKMGNITIMILFQWETWSRSIICLSTILDVCWDQWRMVP